ncbi:MAG: preprotein translocase subunit SecE [Candidatus Omnitrophica bacterium]|nr:preprotein translocase subunit SecE [Candidatus Omnitrophota bacterium]
MPNRAIGFVQEVRGELKKVSWSTREELVASTVVVIAATFLLAVFIGICDLVLSRVVGFLIGS